VSSLSSIASLLYIIFYTLSCFFTPPKPPTSLSPSGLCLLAILCLSNLLILDSYISALTHLWDHGVHKEKSKWLHYVWSRAFRGAVRGADMEDCKEAVTLKCIWRANQKYAMLFFFFFTCLCDVLIRKPHGNLSVNTIAEYFHLKTAVNQRCTLKLPLFSASQTCSQSCQHVWWGFSPMTSYDVSMIFLWAFPEHFSELVLMFLMWFDVVCKI